MSICSHFDLISKDGRSATAIGVISCNHANPSPAKMLDQLYESSHLKMNEMKV